MGDEQETERGQHSEADTNRCASSSSDGVEGSRRRERRTKAGEETQRLTEREEAQEMETRKMVKGRKQSGEKSDKRSGSKETVEDIALKRANSIARLSRESSHKTDKTAQGFTQREPSMNLPRRLFAINQIPPKGRINAYSKPYYLRTMAEVLEGTLEFDVVRESYFGHLFDLPTRC